MKAVELDIIEYDVPLYEVYQNDKLLFTLKYMQEEKLIKTKDRTFLVLQHATLSDNFAETIFENGDLFDLRVTREIRDILSGNKYSFLNIYKNAKLKTFMAEKECRSTPTYRMFFVV
jgi:hypothetical protein